MEEKNKTDSGLISDKLISLGVYVEFSFNSKWRFKYSFPMLQDIVCVSDADKEQAANKFFVEFLKGLHYSLRALYEDGRKDELKNLIEKMKSMADPNIDKTIEIITRTMKL